MVSSFGERLSVRLVSFVLRELGGLRSEAFDAWDLGLLTTCGSGHTHSAYSDASVEPRSYGDLETNLEKLVGTVPVVTGS